MFRLLIRRLYIHFFNKVNGIIIKSDHASIHAQYGKNVLVDRGTIVENDVTIGDYSYVNKNSSIENCTIGKFCSISSGVYICPFEHDLSYVSTHPKFYNSNQKKRRKVQIGNDVLISLNAVILEGVTIGDGAVIGAGAVVTKDVEPYEIVGGVPAHHINYRFAKETIDYLLKIKWWDWSDKEIDEAKLMFSNINSFRELNKNNIR